jgi:hypothetical protein
VILDEGILRSRARPACERTDQGASDEGTPGEIPHSVEAGVV